MSMNPGWDDEKVLTVGDMKKLIGGLDDGVEIKCSDSYNSFIINDTKLPNAKDKMLILEIELW